MKFQITPICLKMNLPPLHPKNSLKAKKERIGPVLYVFYGPTQHMGFYQVWASIKYIFSIKCLNDGEPMLGQDGNEFRCGCLQGFFGPFCEYQVKNVFNLCKVL